jgi:NADH-quinone oxidoreductase subunit M
MSDFHVPWLTIAIGLPLLGAIATHFSVRAETARSAAIVFTGFAFVASIGEWLEFYAQPRGVVFDSYDIFELLTGTPLFSIDELSAPLLPLTSLIYLLTLMTTQRTKSQRFSFSSSLISLAVALATLSCRSAWGVIAFMSIATILPYLELRRREKPTGVYVVHMLLFVVLMICGQCITDFEGASAVHSFAAVVPLMVAILIRSGAIPMHCWMTDLFEHATLGTSILFLTPMTGAYAALRLVLPISPDWTLQWIAVISMATAIYAVGMALVQTDTRRFYCYLLLSQSSLVLVGLEMSTAMSLAGALCIWLSISLAMTGFGLLIRSIEARTGRLSLTDYHGLYDHLPTFAGCFLVTGLASVGFPGTIGFVSLELLIEGTSRQGMVIAFVVIMTSALCGIAVMHAYFRLFTGKRHRTSISLASKPSERIAYLSLIGVIIAAGIVPQPGVATRYHAAVELLEGRQKELRSAPSLDLIHGAIEHLETPIVSER